MFTLSEENILEVAKGLEMGHRCYVHKTNHEILNIPDDDHSAARFDNKLYEHNLNILRHEKDNYHEFNPLPSRVGFQLMTDFVDSLEDSPFKSTLKNAISQPKPFRNFSRELYDAKDVRQEWFNFKTQRIILWVKDRIDYINRFES